MKKIIPILIAVFIGAGFLGPLYSVADAQDAEANQSSAEKRRGPTTGPCVDPVAKRINIIYGKGEISVRPPRVIVERGYVLEFNFAGSIDAVVYIGGKGSDDVWISGNNTHGADKIYVCVDPDLNLGDPPADKTFEYFVNIPGIGKIDPEVIVRD